MGRRDLSDCYFVGLTDLFDPDNILGVGFPDGKGDGSKGKKWTLTRHVDSLFQEIKKLSPGKHSNCNPRMTVLNLRVSDARTNFEIF